MSQTITVNTEIGLPVERVWEYWTEPRHIVNWNFATDDWCCPSAENDLRVGGKLSSRMESKDGKMGFDFIATYKKILPLKLLIYEIADGREVEVHFQELESSTSLVQKFEVDNTFSIEQQKTGWQSILNNFKSYCESSS